MSIKFKCQLNLKCKLILCTFQLKYQSSVNWHLNLSKVCATQSWCWHYQSFRTSVGHWAKSSKNWFSLVKCTSSNVHFDTNNYINSKWLKSGKIWFGQGKCIVFCIDSPVEIKVPLESLPDTCISNTNNYINSKWLKLGKIWFGRGKCIIFCTDSPVEIKVPLESLPDTCISNTNNYINSKWLKLGKIWFGRGKCIIFCTDSPVEIKVPLESLLDTCISKVLLFDNLWRSCLFGVIWLALLIRSAGHNIETWH